MELKNLVFTNPGQAFMDEFEKQQKKINEIVRPEPPQFPIHNFQSNFDALEDARRTALGYAEIIHDRLMAQIAEFETGLTQDEEVGGYLASFGRELLIHIEKVGYRNPYLVVFSGTLDKIGHRIELV